MWRIRIGELRDLYDKDVDAAAVAALEVCRVAVPRVARRQRVRDPFGELVAEVAELSRDASSGPLGDASSWSTPGR